MTSTSATSHRGSGFSESELSDLFVHIGSILPITTHDWENVCSLLGENFPPSRTAESLRRKFNSLVHATNNAGDPIQHSTLKILYVITFIQST